MAAAVKAMKSVSTPQRSVQDPGPLPPQYKLADFKALHELGGGAFGIVQQVVHRETGEVFAMKVLEKRKVVEKGLQEQLKCEVVTQLRAKHPNVVRMHYYFEDAMRVYCLLEYADKGHLFAYLKKHSEKHGGGVPEPRAAAFFADTARGLEYLHGLGVVHRDLKPENILLYTQALVAKIGDLGWCAEITTERPARNTFCGTMDYIAPEMLMNEPHDISVDIWALGVLLFEMLVARAPFVGASHQESVERICAVQVEVPPGSMTAGPAELIQGLLQREKMARMPISKVLQHPWVASLGSSKSTDSRTSDAGSGTHTSLADAPLSQVHSSSSPSSAHSPGGEGNGRSGVNLEERPTRHVPREQSVGEAADTKPVLRETAREAAAAEEALKTDMLSSTNADLYARIREQMDQLNASFRGRVKQEEERRRERLEELREFDPGPRPVLSPSRVTQEASEMQASRSPGSVHVMSEASDTERHDIVDEVAATADWYDSVDEGYVTPPRAPRDNELLSVVQDSCISLEELDCNPSFMLDGQWSKLPDRVSRQNHSRATAKAEERPQPASAEVKDREGAALRDIDQLLDRPRVELDPALSRIVESDSQHRRTPEAKSHQRQQRPQETASGPFAVGRHGLDPHAYRPPRDDTRVSGEEIARSDYSGKASTSADEGWVSSASIVEAGASVWGAFFGGVASTKEQWKDQEKAAASLRKNRRCS